MPKKIEVPLQELRRLIETEKVQQWKAAKALGVSETLVGRWVQRFGLAAQRTGPRGGEQHTGWKGGRILVKGYWHVWCPEHPHAVRGGKYIAEHRKLMEGKLGRYLTPTEVVHHRDGNSRNNVLENLEVFQTNAEHLKHELTGRVPNWTEDGRRQMREGTRQAAIRRKQSKSDDSPRTRTKRPKSR